MSAKSAKAQAISTNGIVTAAAVQALSNGRQGTTMTNVIQFSNVARSVIGTSTGNTYAIARNARDAASGYGTDDARKIVNVTIGLDKPHLVNVTLRRDKGNDQTVSMKLAKYVRKYANNGTDFSDADLEQAYNVFASVLADLDPNSQGFEIVRGEDLRTAYHANNYSPDAGYTLRSSCMRYDRCQPYLDIYVVNDDVCELLVRRDANGQIISRAILWTLSDGRKGIDRVYGDDVDMTRYSLWASANGYIDVRTATEKVTVNLKQAEFDYYPYVDTMSNLTINDDDGTGVLSNHHSMFALSLCYTDGGPNNTDTYRCAGCGYEVDEDDTVYVHNDIYCCDCTFYCDHCDERHVGGGNWHNHLGRWGMTLCDSCENELTCPECDTITLEGGECDDCAVPRCTDCRNPISNPIEEILGTCIACCTDANELRRATAEYNRDMRVASHNAAMVAMGYSRVTGRYVY